MMRVLCSAMVCAALACSAQIEWAETAGGAWNVPANWSPATVPNDATHAAVLGLAGSYDVALTSAMYPTVSLNTLTLGGGSPTLTVTGTTLDLTAGATGAITIAGPSSAAPATLVLSGTTLSTKGGVTLGGSGTFGRLEVNDSFLSNMQERFVRVTGAGSAFVYNDTSAVPFNSRLAYIYLPSGGQMEISSGTLTLNRYAGSFIQFTNAGHLKVTGGTLVPNRIEYKDDSGGTPLLLDVSAGHLIVQNSTHFGSGTFTRADPKGGAHKINVTGGTMTVNTALNLGGINNRSNRGIAAHTTMSNGARLSLSGGTVIANAVNLGMSVIGASTVNTEGYRFGSDGFWYQTGGEATVKGAFSMQQIVTGHPDDPFPRGAREFVVANDAVLTFTGTGMVASNFGEGWLLTPDDWDASGTLVFAPATAQDQNLLAFAEDQGAKPEGFSAGFAYGTLDLSALDADGERLVVSAADNFGSNALYVNNLLGLDLATNSPTLKYLDSTVNIYYDATSSANRYLIGSPFYELTSGGFLVGVGIPEPGSLALLAMATLAAASRRRRA